MLIGLDDAGVLSGRWEFLSIAGVLLGGVLLGLVTSAPAAAVEAREIAFAKTMADRDLDAFRSAHTGSGGLTRVKN